MNDHARRGRAALTGGSERAPQHTFKRKLQIGVFHDHDHVLAAHLERANLVRGRARLPYGPADFGRSGERDKPNLRVVEQGFSHYGAVSRDDVQNAGRHTGFGKRRYEIVSRKRRCFGGFDHHRVAAHERGQNFPRRNRHWKIPRRDQSAHADRLARTHRVLIRKLGLRRVAVKPAAFARDEVSHVDRFLHIAASFFQHLAHLASHIDGAIFFAPDEDLACFEKYFGAARRGNLAPFLESFGGDADRATGVVGG